MLSPLKLTAAAVLLTFINGCGGEGTTRPDEFLLLEVTHSVTQTEAVISWQTNLPSRGYVRYGLSESALDSATALSDSFSLTCSDTLRGLAVGTNYYYRVVAQSEEGEQAQSSLRSFQTLEFLILEVIHSVTQTEAVISWQTNLPAKGYVRYGLSQSALDSATALSDSFSLTCSDTLRSLAAGTNYYYRVTARSEEDEQAQSSLRSFQTLPKPNQEPALYNLTIEGITTNSASINWYTDEPADAWVYFDTTASAYNDSTGSGVLTLAHRIQLTGLSPSTRYYFRAVSSDSEGYSGYSPDSSFITLNPVYLIFPDTTVAVGESVLYPVLIENALDLLGIQYYLQYDPALLTAQAMSEGPFTTNSNHQFFIPVIDTPGGRIKNFISWIPEDSAGIEIGTRADGDGIVAYVEFYAVSAGTCSIISPGAASLQDSIFVVFFDTPSQRSELLINPGQIVVTAP